MVPHGAGQPDDEPEQAAPAPAEAAGWQPLDLVTGTLGVLLVIAALLGLAAALWPAELASAATPDGPRVPWWVLAVMFGLVELFVLHVQVRREAQTVSICEIPLVLGLFFASPGALILGRLVGPALVFAFHRRQVPIKLGYNLALLCANSVLALAVFAAFHLGARQHGVSTWLATYAAVAAAGALDAVATTVAIAAYERTLNWLDLAREPLLEAARAIAVGTLALVAVYALAVDGGAAVPLVGSALIVLVAYRAYARLNGRHLSLERLYRFSQAVSSNPEVQEVIRNVLTEARELLRAERADIVFLSADDQGPAVRMLLTPDGRLVRSEVAGLAAPGSMALRVLEQGTPMLLPHGSREPAKREHLAASGLRDAIIAPLKGDSGVVALVTVADRLGDVRTFDSNDVRLLETLINHAGVALQNSQLLDRLRHDALHDALTGLPNRAFIQRALVEALRTPWRPGPTSTAVMILDLDRFKEVNDTLGHQYGDMLLVEVARRLDEAAGSEAVVARLGGDEFAIVVPRAGSEGEVMRCARSLLTALTRPVDLDGHQVEVGGSIGVALAPEHGTETSTIFKRADLAMYDAKTSKAGIRVFHPGISGIDPGRLALIGELRTAIAQRQLHLLVQPKVRLDTMAVDSVEVLVRWAHPVHGLLTAGDFVPDSERSGLIGPLMRFVLREAILACSTWRAAGRDLGVAVNVSAGSLVDPLLAVDLGALLREHDVPPELLTFEISETSVLIDPSRTIGLLEQLDAMDVRLSIDDFGTGYSSLAYLKRLPVHEVKIDRSFVTNMCNDDDDAKIVRSIIDLAGNLSLQVVAEGVENEATTRMLRELGCGSAQGWHLGRPMPVDRLLPWLLARETAHGPGRPVVAQPATSTG